jgi:hypothetical protein
VGEFGNEIGGGVAAVGFGPSDRGESFREKAIAREYCDRFTKDAVIGGAAAAKIIIVHAGEIVVNQGVGVDAFHSASGGNCERLVSPNSPSGGEAEDGTQAFASCEKTVAHGSVNEGGLSLSGDKSIEGFFHQRKAGFPVGL